MTKKQNQLKQKTTPSIQPITLPLCPGCDTLFDPTVNRCGVELSEHHQEFRREFDPLTKRTTTIPHTTERNFYCTRERAHSGKHIACGQTVHKIRVWNNTSKIKQQTSKTL